MINYHDRRFVPVETSPEGEVNEEVGFHYRQARTLGDLQLPRWAHRAGAADRPGGYGGPLDMRYHQVNDRGEPMTGVCRSIPSSCPMGGCAWKRPDRGPAAMDHFAK